MVADPAAMAQLYKGISALVKDKSLDGGLQLTRMVRRPT
jgi:hypothetical protein